MLKKVSSNRKIKKEVHTHKMNKKETAKEFGEFSDIVINIFCLSAII